MLSPDGNTEGSSSTPSDGNGQDSSTAEQDGNSATEGEAETKPEGEDGGESSESTAGEQEADGQQNGQQEESGETKEGEEAQTEREKFIPRERFDEVNTKVTTYERELADTKPLVEQSNALNTFMRDNHISTQEFQNALQYLAALRTNPAEAFKMLQPTYDQLALLNGDRLPADLQAKVAATTLSEEDAREIAKARAQQTYTQWQQQRNQQAGQQSQAELVQQTMGQWTSTKQTQDPDLKQGSPLWEQTQLRINAMPVFKSPQEAWAGAEKAYGEAKKFLSGLQPRSVSSSKRPPQSQATNTGTGYQVDTSKSVDEQAKQVARLIGKGARPSQIRYT